MRFIILICSLFFFFDAHSNSFREIFGSEGQSGVLNPKTRSLSYALQYLTVTGTTGYLLKQLHDNAFFEPLGIIPDALIEGSPLAYGNYNVIDDHSANIIKINENVDKLNYSNKLKEDFFRNRYSTKSIEIKNNSNLLKSEIRKKERERLVNRYLDD